MERAEIRKSLQRTVLLGAILLFSHLLQIRPTELDALGLKIGVDDARVVRGAIALMFMYYFILAATHSPSITRDQRTEKIGILRDAMAYHRRVRPLLANPSPAKPLKQQVRARFTIHAVLFGWWGWLRAACVIAALVFAFIDLYRLAAYAFHKVVWG